MDVEVATPPPEESVRETEERENAEEGGDDHACDFDAEPGAVGEGVEGVRWLFLVSFRDHDLAGGEGFLGLRVAKLRDRERSWDTHDAR